MQHNETGAYPLMTKDPVTGDPLIVTRLEGPRTGIVIEGQFSLGWIGQLTPDQLAFVGLLVRHRANLQKLAAELNIAYNTARNRMDEIVAALTAEPVKPVFETSPPEPERADHASHTERSEILDQLAAGEISAAEAMRLLQS